MNMTLPKDPARRAAYLRLLSESHKGQHSSPATEFKRGHETWNKGLTKETDPRVARYVEKVSKALRGQKPWNTGKHWPAWVKKKFSEVHKGKPSPNKGKKFPLEWCRKLSEARKRLYREQPEHLKNWFKSINARPNKSELRLLEILRRINPTWRYVGDGSLIIDGKCPDFWDGDGRLVELYGDYWHKNDDPQERIDFFKEHGYDCTVVWESELKDGRGILGEVQAQQGA